MYGRSILNGASNRMYYQYQQVNVSELMEIYNTTLHGGFLPMMISSSTYILTIKWLLHSMVTLMFGNEFFAAGLLLMLLNHLVNGIQTILSRLLRLIYNKLFFSLHINSDDESFQWVMEWLAHHDYSRKCQNLSVHSTWSSDTNQLNGYSVLFGHNSRKQRVLLDEDQKRPELLYVPSVGSHIFFYKGHLVWFSRYSNDSGLNIVNRARSSNMIQGSNIESIHLYMFGFSGRTLLRSLIEEARELSYSDSMKKTYIYTAGQYHQSWMKTAVRKIRALDSVILPDNIKNKVVQDLKDFRSSREWYAKCGVPYRRGILFYGPPGTGKSSTIIAIAGELQMGVCILSLSSFYMNDQILQELMNSAPMNCILLLEDIDSAFPNEEEVKENKINMDEMIPFKNKRFLSGRNELTFAGLLNAIDGVASQEGRILFMTTNCIEKLDLALIRPGRVDLRLEFKLATKEQVKGMFLKFYPEEKELANEVSNRIPEDTVSTAQLQGFFLLHKNNPEEIIHNIPQFLKECEEQQTRKANIVQNGNGTDDEKTDRSCTYNSPVTSGKSSKQNRKKKESTT